MAIEINTSGVFGPGVPFPDIEILRWAREAGVPPLTIGTDSHEPGTFARGLAEGFELADRAGWTEFTVYSGRSPARRVPVEEARAWAGAARRADRGTRAAGGAPGDGGSGGGGP